jgi:RNA polymerase sigma factor (sigma-70 family)
MPETDEIVCGTGPTSRIADERVRLVRLCAHLTGDSDAAEDLAQETLIEAWSHADELRDRTKRPQWLTGIARNVCLMWARRRSRESARMVRRLEQEDGLPLDLDRWIAGEFDLDVELERHELMDLLDRALARLSSETRQVLIERYIHESPHWEIAARLGLTENTLAKRLERGKCALKKVLTTDLRSDAATFGLTSATTEIWHETRIWCPRCGRRKFEGRFGLGGDLQLDCPSCFDGKRAIAVRGSVAKLVLTSEADPLKGIRGYKPALNRIFAQLHAYYADGIDSCKARCPHCRNDVPIRTTPVDGADCFDVQTNCPDCRRGAGIARVSAVALMRPEGRAFWRENGRIRLLSERTVEAVGVPAIVCRMESIVGSAFLDVIFARDSLEVLGVHGTSRRQ